jgi:hypothetical protein
MTDHPTADTPEEPTTAGEDELVSAVLDGEATPAERARVEGDPRLRARLASFTAVREAVGEVPPVADAARDASIANALDRATDAAFQQPGPDAHSLAAARSRRRRRVATIVAAAAVAVVAVPLLAIALTGRRTEEKLASTGEAVSESADDQASARDAAPSSTTTSPLIAPSPEAQRLAAGPIFVGDLGPISAIAELRFAVQAALVDSDERLRASNSAFALSDTDALRCATAVAAADPSVGLPLMTSTATWKGVPAFVTVFATLAASPPEPTDVPVQLIVVTGADCTVIERVTR